MSSKVFHLFAIFLTFVGTAYADDFGQDISADLDKAVAQAREMRLPYYPSYDPQKAIQELKNIIEEKPDYYRALFNLALAYAEVKDYQSALDTFQSALSVRSKYGLKDPTIYNSAGWVSLSAGRYDEAIDYFETGLKSESTNPAYTNGAYTIISVLRTTTSRISKERYRSCRSLKISTNPLPRKRR